MCFILRKQDGDLLYPRQVYLYVLNKVRDNSQHSHASLLYLGAFSSPRTTSISVLRLHDRLPSRVGRQVSLPSEEWIWRKHYT